MNIPLLDLLGKGIDKIFPDKAERDKHKAEMLRLAQDGEFRELDAAMDAIVMEAKSTDPWTSRARPSFLYVMYIMILAAVPMGVLNIFSPESADAIIKGVQAWLHAMPEELWMLFGAGYLGYAKKRSDDKEVIKGGKPKKLLGIF